MNRICKIFCSLLAARLLLSFGWAVFARDPDTAAKPQMTVSGLLDGSYIRDYEHYYADAYPNREAVLEDFEWMKGIYGIRDEK